MTRLNLGTLVLWSWPIYQLCLSPCLCIFSSKWLISKAQCLFLKWAMCWVVFKSIDLRSVVLVQWSAVCSNPAEAISTFYSVKIVWKSLNNSRIVPNVKPLKLIWVPKYYFQYSNNFILYPRVIKPCYCSDLEDSNQTAASPSQLNEIKKVWTTYYAYRYALVAPTYLYKFSKEFVD